jgi:bifunctional UDP-N-acetylglucosamine pyrophosphorylase/glucosamine-1-phosphate N-acetyltransferase
LVVYGHGGEAVKTAFADEKGVIWVEQAEQLGTGHAMAQALPSLDPASAVLVLYGDVPLIQPETLQPLVAEARQGRLALLTVELADPSGYGRIVRDERGRVRRIVEEKDATASGAVPARDQYRDSWRSRLRNCEAGWPNWTTTTPRMSTI